MRRSPTSVHNRPAPLGALARKFLLLVLGIALLGQAWALPAALGQGVDEPIVGLEDSYELLEQEWEDPIEVFNLADEPLAPEPAFNFAEIQPSDVFEPGVEALAVREEVDVALESERHVRALQTVATAELALQTAGENITTAEASIVTATNRIAAARREITDLEAQIAQLNIENDDITSADRAEVEEQDRLNGDVDQYNVAITELAVQAFIGQDDDLVAIFEDPGSSKAVERRIVTDEIRNGQREDIVDLEGLISESVGRREVLAAELAVVEMETSIRLDNIATLNGEIADLDNERIDLLAEIAELEERELELAPIIEETFAFTQVTAAHYQVAYHERLAQFVDQTDLPLVALNAYIRASGTLAVEDPGCGIHWSQLAGIGRIESLHGYFGESTLDVNGHTTVDILGIPLDGRTISTSGPAGVQRLALIRDTDRGVLDGDIDFDRAVGPMQFIPSTWRLYHSDGNGDTITDPQNVYDAALASARLLCDAGGTMLTAEGEQRAYFGYNHDFNYSRNVTLAGRRYHSQISIAEDHSPRFAAYAESGAAEALADLNVFGPPVVECEADGESDETTAEGVADAVDAGEPSDEAVANGDATDASAECTEPESSADGEDDENGEGEGDLEDPPVADEVDAAPETTVAPVPPVEPEVLEETETNPAPEAPAPAPEAAEPAPEAAPEAAE